MNKRTNNLCNMFADYGIDAILISQPDNRFYLSGFHGSAGYLLISDTKAVLATDFRYVEQARNQAPEYEILRISNSIKDWFPGLLKEIGAKRLGFEAEFISFNMYKILQDSLLSGDSGETAFVRKPIVKAGSGPRDKTIDLNLKNTSATDDRSIGMELVPVAGMVEKLREIKEPTEIEYIKKAVEIADTAFEEVADNIEAGMTEKQVAWEMEKGLRENGSEAIPFEIIVASGPNAALPHAHPSDRMLREGDPIVIDMGATYCGYASDLSRTLYIGVPDDMFKRVYGIVLDAQQAAMSIIKEGTTGQEADDAARKVITKAGYGEAFGHALGHGVGLAEHELPRLGQGADNQLTAGMVFTVEPGIYLSGWGGVRIEDTVMLVDGKAESISRARKARYD